MRAAYTGHEPLTFPDYLDASTGRTLHAEPGGTYDITPAGGPVPDVPVPWFTPVKEPRAVVKAAPAKAAVPVLDAGEPAKF